MQNAYKQLNNSTSQVQKSGEIIAKLIDDDLSISDTETSIELNFAVLKFKHTIKKGKK